MSDAQKPIGAPTNMGAAILEWEIRGVTFPSDPEVPDGYQIRFVVQPEHGASSQWTPWLYLPNSHLVELIEGLVAYMHQEGHLATSRGASVQ